jgi:hypothetical protein
MVGAMTDQNDNDDGDKLNQELQKYTQELENSNSKKKYRLDTIACSTRTSF